jgi:hypothetical protein
MWGIYCLAEELFDTTTIDRWIASSLRSETGDKSIIYIWVTYTEDTSLYCDHFIWYVSRTAVVLTCFVMCWCFENCVGVLAICVLVFTVFLYCLYCVLYCFVYVYLFLFVLSVLV